MATRSAAAIDFAGALRHPATRTALRRLSDGEDFGHVAVQTAGDLLVEQVSRALGLAPRAPEPVRRPEPVTRPVVIDAEYEVIEVNPGVRRRWRKPDGR